MCDKTTVVNLRVALVVNLAIFIVEHNTLIGRVLVRLAAIVVPVLLERVFIPALVRWAG